MIYIVRKEHFNAAHKLLNPNWSDKKNMEEFGVCSNENWHGHNYEIEVTIKGEINPKSSSDFIMEINRIPSNQIVIYIQSPGGYVESGKEIINEINIQLKNGKDISCIADRAYSMAFIIFQS